MQIEQFIGFAAVSLALALVPGPSWLYVISTTLGRDRSTGLIAVFGNAAGIACHVLAVAAGLSALLSYSATFYLAVKWAGAGYLVYLGIRTLRQASITDSEHLEQPPSSTLRVFGQGLLVNCLNPKVALVMLALLPQFVDEALGRVPAQLVVIGLVHAVIATIVLTTVALATAGANRRLRHTPRLLRILRSITGWLLVAVALRLVLAKAA